MKEIRLEDALTDSLSFNIAELGVDISDASLGAMMDILVGTSVPIFSLVNNLAKVGLCIRDRKFAKNTLVFLNQLNNGLMSSEDIDKHIETLNKDSKRKQREMNLIAILLDNFVNEKKAIYLANLYRSNIQGLMEWGDFEYLAVLLNSFNVFDENQLKIFYENDLMIYESKGWSEASISRLRSLGLIVKHKKKTLNQANERKVIGRLSSEGIMFYELALLGHPIHYHVIPFYWEK